MQESRRIKISNTSLTNPIINSIKRLSARKASLAKPLKRLIQLFARHVSLDGKCQLCRSHVSLQPVK